LLQGGLYLNNTGTLCQGASILLNFGQLQENLSETLDYQCGSSNDGKIKVNFQLITENFDAVWRLIGEATCAEARTNVCLLIFMSWLSFEGMK